jgi:predicted MarR family transcription regulator
VRYVLLFCPQWKREREKELEDIARNLKEVLGIKHGATAAIRLILKTGLLEQFKATVQAKEKRRRGAREEQG